MEVDQISVFVGIDVGKSEHWAHALNRAGKKLLDKPLPNDETKLRSLYQDLAKHGTVLVVVDQVSHHWCPGRGGSPGHGYHCGLPARSVHAPYR